MVLEQETAPPRVAERFKKEPKKGRSCARERQGGALLCKSKDGIVCEECGETCRGGRDTWYWDARREEVDVDRSKTSPTRQSKGLLKGDWEPGSVARSLAQNTMRVRSPKGKGSAISRCWMAIEMVAKATDMFHCLKWCPRTQWLLLRACGILRSGAG